MKSVKKPLRGLRIIETGIIVREFRGSVAQRSEQVTHNLLVVGSNPAGSTTFPAQLPLSDGGRAENIRVLHTGIPGVPHPLDTEAVLAESGRALRRLRRLIRYPRPAEVEFLLVPDRSADFGKRESTPVIVRNATAHGNYWRTVKWSLWPPGTIAASGGGCVAGRQLLWQTLRRIRKIRGAV